MSDEKKADLVKQIKEINPDANVEGLEVKDLEGVLKALQKKAEKPEKRKAGVYVCKGKSVTVRGKVLGENEPLPEDFPKEAVKNLIEKDLVEVQK